MNRILRVDYCDSPAGIVAIVINFGRMDTYTNKWKELKKYLHVILHLLKEVNK